MKQRHPSRPIAPAPGLPTHHLSSAGATAPRAFASVPRPLAAPALALLLTMACYGTVYTDSGIIFVPAPEGDDTEVAIENLLRDATGIWMGTDRGLAIDELTRRTGADYSGPPTSGGITSLRIGASAYFSLYAYPGPPGSSTHLVCGYSLRTATGGPPPVVPVAEIRALLEANNSTLRRGTALYRKTPRRAISLYPEALFYVDTSRCPQRDPGLPELEEDEEEGAGEADRAGGS